MKRCYLAILLTLTVWGMASCGHRHDYVPKPTAYLRFDFPAKSYHTYDTTALKFTFEKSDEAHVVMKRDNSREQYIDLVYPNYNATVFLTYKQLSGAAELQAQTDTAYKFVSQHFDHSSGVDEKQYQDLERHLLARTYHLKGKSVASTYQFWATDSTHHFLRGALFLMQTPNNDSLAPTLEYLQQDLNHLVETIHWK